jgi:uncharacterized repeat protein (TIGR03803 family)
MTKLNGWKMASAVFAFCLATAIASSAQTFTSLISFDVANGETPESSLVQGLDGNFYGTTAEGGIVNETQCPGGCGTVFEITPTGQLTTIYNFCSQSECTDGQNPGGNVIVGPGGNLYGTTTFGGANDSGTVFEITPARQLITLYSFCTQKVCADGENPIAGLAVGTNGDLYGTTQTGGAHGSGTIFEITPATQLATIYNFCSLPNCNDGQFPTGLVLGTDGNFYGTTADNAGRRSFGSAYGITPAGKLIMLHRFCSEPHCTDGANPYAGLVQGRNGNFYGTTVAGGANETSCLQGCGTVFEITPAGQLTTLYSFCSQSDCFDGVRPAASLILATNGDFYGTTDAGGVISQCPLGGCGTAFKITPSGWLTTLYNFCSQTGCSDGYMPTAGLVLATNGNLYGTTKFGGTGDCNSALFTGCGTVFALSKAVKPFVEPLPGFGIVGAEVGILGNKLTGATSVTFNGTPATFTVKSSTLIFASVPTGATTGYVYVTTANGTLKSNVPFRVMR